MRAKEEPDQNHTTAIDNAVHDAGKSDSMASQAFVQWGRPESTNGVAHL